MLPDACVPPLPKLQRASYLSTPVPPRYFGTIRNQRSEETRRLNRLPGPAAGVQLCVRFRLCLLFHATISSAREPRDKGTRPILLPYMRGEPPQALHRSPRRQGSRRRSTNKHLSLPSPYSPHDGMVRVIVVRVWETAQRNDLPTSARPLFSNDGKM